MGLLQTAKQEMAFLKMGIYGGEGSGKTYTASGIAIGLHEYIKSKKSIAFLDTETGSDFLLPKFKEAKIDLVRAKTTSFADLLTVMKEAEESVDILLIDSVTHLWNDLLDSYLTKNKLTFMALKHWGPVKKMWREFSMPFVNSSLHIILCGRSADKWEDVEDESGAKELTKVGTKMKTEGEMSYEPSLLVEMEQVNERSGKGGGWIHRAWVKKDRFGIINGQCFENPTFEDFLPHISRLGLGGEHKGTIRNDHTEDLFDDDNRGEKAYRRRKILLDEIAEEIKSKYPGQSTEDKKGRQELMMELFNTKSWMKVEEVKDEAQLMNALASLKGTSENKKEEAVMDDGSPAPF